MYNALVIGCGNIGALYDKNNDNILTHLKGYKNKGIFDISIYDSNKKLTLELSSKYNCKIIEDINNLDYSYFDSISICTPTDTHYYFLKKSIESNVKSIICEKPISYSYKELYDIVELQNNSNSKILVNYIRRFQKYYIKLKKYINKLKKEQNVKNISIFYQRGFLNNCSHAFDLIEFLFDEEIILSNITKSNVLYDTFDKDPTLSFQSLWNKSIFSVVGLTDIKYSIFEIYIFFESYRINITNSGNDVDIYEITDQKSNRFFIKEDLSSKFIMENYMISVIDSATEILNGDILENNFLQSISINRKMLDIINL